MNGTFSVPITQLKQNPAGVISDVNTKGLSAIIMQRSKPKAIIADYEYFISLEEGLMDFMDGIEAEIAKKEPTLSLKTYIKKRWGKSF